MCGILAHYSIHKTIEDDKIKRAICLMHERGPDSKGFKRFQECILGNSRLNIVDDNPNSNMPLRSMHKDVWITFNGMIYNYKELRAELIADGFKFRTNSDTEVIVNMYIKHGPGFERHLRGMWALAIWDNDNKLFFVSRDRFGIKPLFYQAPTNGNCFLFASELPPVFFLSDEPTGLDHQYLIQYLAKAQDTPHLTTPIINIREFPPSHSAIIRSNNFHSYRYYKAGSDFNESISIDELKDTFIDNVDRHLVGNETNFALTLSAGVDSNSLANCINLIKKNELVSAYTIQSPNSKESLSEISHYASSNNIKLSTIDLTNVNIPDSIVRMISRTKTLPFNLSDCYQFLIQEEIHGRGHKVLLTGEGGDEVCAGYNSRFIRPYLLNLEALGDSDKFKYELDQLCKIQKTTPEAFLNSLHKRHKQHPDVVNKQIQSQDPALFEPPQHVNDNPLLASLYTTLTQGTVRSLTLSDHIAGANSIEARVPFLDHVFLEKYWSMPIQNFFSNGRGKAYIRRIMSDINPLAVFSDNNPKRPKPGNYYALINDDSMFEFAMQYLSQDQKNDLLQMRSKALGNDEQIKKYFPLISICYRQLFLNVWREQVLGLNVAV